MEKEGGCRGVGESGGGGIYLDKDRILKEKEEELKKMTEMVAKMQAQMLHAATFKWDSYSGSLSR